MNESKKVAWNASEGLIMEISNRRSMANSHFISGSIKKAFKTLISIKQSVIQSFNASERNDLKKIESKFLQLSPILSSNYSSSFNTKSRELFSLANQIISKEYSDYNDKLMDLLEKYGYLIGEQSDSSKMKF
jgi:hypothetical protein